MADGRKVNTDLVCSPGFKATFNERTSLEFPQRSIVRDSVFSRRGSLGQHRHFLAVGIRTPDSRGDRGRGRIGPAVADGQVDALDRMIGELAREAFVGNVGL